MKKMGVTNNILQLEPIANKNHFQSFMPTEMITLSWFLNLKNKK